MYVKIVEECGEPVVAGHETFHILFHFHIVVIVVGDDFRYGDDNDH